LKEKGGRREGYVDYRLSKCWCRSNWWL